MRRGRFITATRLVDNSKVKAPTTKYDYTDICRDVYTLLLAMQKAMPAQGLDTAKVSQVMDAVADLHKGIQSALDKPAQVTAPKIQSGILQGTYKDWAAKATPEQVAFVDAVYKVCEDGYEKGGDTCIETMDPEEVIKHNKGSLKPLSAQAIKRRYFYKAERGDY